MRALDAEEREAMACAVTPNTGPCPKCGTPIPVGEDVFPSHLEGALRRCVARGLVRYQRCGDSFDLHFDATPTGRMVFALALSATKGDSG